MEIDIFTLFPEAFGWFERQHHVANATSRGHRIGYVNYRDHTPLKAGQVDDTPFGGGAGMVLRVDVVEAALRARYGRDPVELRSQRLVIALTPAGRQLDDALVDELARQNALTLLSGRYEGFDQRVLDHFVSQELSIGPYVLAGGDLAALARSLGVADRVRMLGFRDDVELVFGAADLIAVPSSAPDPLPGAAIEGAALFRGSIQAIAAATRATTAAARVICGQMRLTAGAGAAGGAGDGAEPRHGHRRGCRRRSLP